MPLADTARDLGQIAEIAVVAPSWRQFREQVLDLLARAIGFDKASMQSHGPADTWHECARGYEHMAEFANISRYMCELAPQEIAVASQGKPIVDVEVISPRRRDRLNLYQRVLWPERVTVFTTAMWRAEDAVCGVNLARTGRGARFSARELATLACLLPVIRIGDALVTSRQRAAEVPSFEAWAARLALSTREHEVAALVVRGLANREIAALLRVSVHTVRNQLASVFRKAAVSTRAELVFMATTTSSSMTLGQPPRWCRHVP